MGPKINGRILPNSFNMSPVKLDAQLRGPSNIGPLYSASKYVEELGPIKWNAQLSRGQIMHGPLCLESVICP